MLAMLVALLGFGLTGCGDDGKDGKDGINGVDGADGTNATVGVETLAALGLVYADDVTPINPTLDLSKTVSYDATTGAVTVHFFLTDENGDGIDVTAIPYEMRMYVSELLPAVAGTTENQGAAWTQLFNERGTPAVEGSEMPGTLTLVDAATGEYNYVASNTIAATDNPIRITMRARFRFRDLNNDYIVVANPVNASYDFLLADPATKLSPATTDLAQLVTTAACEACHGARIGDVGHGGGYTQVATCNHCHNVNYMATRDLEADLGFMIHRIHAAGVFEGLGDFSEVTYPQETSTCATCHDGAQAADAYTVVTRLNCNGCHDKDFTTAGNADSHSGGVMTNDASCLFCHSEGGLGKGPIEAHNVTPSAANTPEYVVSISLSADDDDTPNVYEEGDAPIVTVTLTPNDGGAVANYVATAADAKGTRDGNLSAASLYVYGPRADAVPVLTTGSTTDPAFAGGNPTQSHALFNDGVIGTGDDQVISDATGFKYQLLPIPAGMSGTYMIHFEGADYGGVADNDYVTSSTGDLTFQVGTATVEPKLSGDACIECHGDTRMHLEGSHAHNTPFDTDACLACHDRTGNYGDYIGNRVHAVHSASPTGDALSNHSTDWSEVTYPQPANNCIVCHTNTEVATPVWRTPDGLACSGCHGSDPLAVPADYPNADPNRVTAEAAAAAHMTLNGWDGTEASTGVGEACYTCHGEGKIADPYETHGIIRFRALPVDPNE